MNDQQPPPKMMDDMKRLKQFRPYMIVAGALWPDGTYTLYAMPTMRQANDAARKGAQVWTVQ